MAKYKPIRIGDTVPLQQISPASEEIDGKIYVSQTGVVLGRASAGDGPHEEILFEDLPGGGGGASYTEITYADMQTAIAGGTLTPGGWYLITDAPGTDLGFLTYAVTENSISVAGVGGYLNADFQAVGNYDGVEAITGVAPGTRHEIWRTSFESLTITYTNLAGGVFAVGDTITGGTTGATAVITSDDGVSALMAYMTSAGVAFDGSEVLDNGSGVTADMTGIELGPTIALGDIVIWNLLHWQLTDDTVLDGTDPATNTAAYTQLQKTDADQGYITAWDVSELDFSLNDIVYRQDVRGGLVRGSTGVQGYQWGRDDCAGNNIQSAATFDILNLLASFNRNTAFPGTSVSEIVTGADTAIEDNILENGASLTGITAGTSCSISRNKIGQGATMGGDTTMGDAAEINENSLFANAFIGSVSAGAGAVMSGNTVGLSGNISDIDMADGTNFTGNIFGVTASVSTVVLLSGVDFNFNTINANSSFGNKTLHASITNNFIGIEVSVIEDIFQEIDRKIVQPSQSTVPDELDITGLTTLDCLEENNYVGIFNLTSSNATEAIDTITNPPTAFPFTLRPAAGLVLTITGTAYAGIMAGQIALKATDYTLDGDKGEYIVLEIDPLGTGALIEKYVVNGII